MGLGIRLLPVSAEENAVAARVKFPPKFDRNRKDKRALISSSSIFSSPAAPAADKRRLELETKRRKIKAAATSNLLAGGFKPSSWSENAGSKRVRDGALVAARKS